MNSRRSVTRKYDYRAFGEQLSLYEAPGTGEGSGYLENPFGFTGREIEHGTDLYHYRSRSYDPMVGRFLSADPYTSMVMMGQGLSNASAGGFNPLMMGMGNCGAGCGMNSLTASGAGISAELARLLINPQSMNAFGYVTGNPLIFKDPYGLASVYIVDTAGVPYSQDFTTYPEFENILQKYADSPNKIQHFEYIGHGRPGGGALDFHEGDFRTGGVFAGTTKEWQENNQYRNIASIADLLRNAFNPKATITLKACYSSSESKSPTIASELSRILPNAAITGYPALITHIPGTKIVFPSIWNLKNLRTFRHKNFMRQNTRTGILWVKPYSN